MDLYEYLHNFHPIKREDYELLHASMKVKSFRKNEFITLPGQIQKNLYFVREGIQMSFYESESHRHVIAFTYPINLCAVPESFALQQPSAYSLVSLTDSQMDFITFDALQRIFDQSHDLERLFRKMTEVMLAGMISRHLELRATTIEERFKAFCNRSGHLLQKVPHKYIASYLNIDPTNFSKLYNSVKF